MKTVVTKKWGNNASVRIPRSVMAAAGISFNQPVGVRAEPGRIIVEPVRHEYDLADLIDGITDENRHGEIAVGVPRGKEAL